MGMRLRRHSILNGGFTPSDISKAEADILIALYDETAGPDWTDSTNWKVDKVVDNWYGITVTTGYVTGIDLSSNNLVGAINAELGSLTELTSADLSGNTLTGVDDFVVALAASVAANDRTGTLNISGASMEALTYGTEGDPSDSATAIMALLDAGWTITVAGESTIATHSVTAGDTKLATVDGGAMFFDDNIDFSSYANSTRWLEFVDSGSKVAKAYAEDVGGGEALGTELIVASDDRDFTVFANVRWTGASGGSVADGTGKLEVTMDSSGSSGAGLAADKINNSVPNSLYKLAADIWRGTTTSTNVRMYSPATVVYKDITITASQVAYSFFYTTNTTNESFQIFCTASDSGTFFIDNASLKKLTDVPATGLHLVSAKSGSTRNMTSVETGFNPNAITTIRVKDVMPDWILNTYVVDSGTAHIATADGETMCFHDTIDLSDLAGTDCLLRATDAAGKIFEAYVDTVGGGEALGSDLLSGWDFTSGWTATNASIDSANSFTTTSDYGYIKKNVDINYQLGSLYKRSFDASETGGRTWLRVFDSLYMISDTYKTKPLSGTNNYTRIYNIDSGETSTINSMNIKKVTDVPATGLLLVSESGGATRNASYIETGFNPNTVVKIEAIGVPA